MSLENIINIIQTIVLIFMAKYIYLIYKEVPSEWLKSYLKNEQEIRRGNLLSAPKTTKKELLAIPTPKVVKKVKTKLKTLTSAGTK